MAQEAKGWWERAGGLVGSQEEDLWHTLGTAVAVSLAVNAAVASQKSLSNTGAQLSPSALWD